MKRKTKRGGKVVFMKNENKRRSLPWLLTDHPGHAVQHEATGSLATTTAIVAADEKQAVAAVLHNHHYHEYLLLRVVVTHTAAQNIGGLCAGKCLLPFMDFTLYERVFLTLQSYKKILK